MIVGCYTMHLYCRNRDDDTCVAPMQWKALAYNAEYTGRTYTQCVTQAKKDGWKFDKEADDVTCPECTKSKMAAKSKDNP